MKIIKTSEALPKSGRYVLAWLEGAKIPMRAMWADQHTLPLGDDADPEWGEYSEEKDEYFCPAGWYEMNQFEEQHWGVSGNVVAWCELPRLDHQCLAQIEEPAQPIAGYRISDPSDPTIKPWLSETPDDNGYKSEPLYAGAAPAAVAPRGEYPHEQMDAMALDRYKVVPSNASMLWSHAVVAGDGTQQLYVGREVECQNMVRKFAGAFLDGAFAFHSTAAAPTAQAAPALEAPAAPMTTAEACAALAINSALHRIRAGNAAGAIEPLEQARAALAAAPQAPAASVDDLAQLVKQLAQALRKAAPNHVLPAKALDYLRRQGLQGSPLRAAPAAPAVDAWLQPDDMAALQRFHETAEDDESYDIGKEAVARLCAFGCLQSHSFGRYSTTDFGDYLLDTWAGARTLPFTTAAEREALAAQAEAKGEHDE